MAIPQHVGYLSLFLIVLLGEAGLPLFAPAELLLIAAGVSAQNQDASLGLVIALARPQTYWERPACLGYSA